jgi:DNA sulfur modification protein DndB
LAPFTEFPRAKNRFSSQAPLSHVSGDTRLTIEKAAIAVSQYLALYSSKLEAHWNLGDAKGGYLCTNNGIRALLQLFSKVIDFVARKETLKPNVMDAEYIVDKVAPYIGPVIEFFATASATEIAYFRQRGSSLASVDQNCRQMMAIINESNPTFTSPDLINYLRTRDVEGTREAKDFIDEINVIIFEDVIKTLKEHYGEDEKLWWMQGIPAPIRSECDKRYNESQGERDRWRYLFFINYVDILMYRQNWDLFKDYYNIHGKGKKSSLVRWMQKINKHRTVTHHAEKGPLSKKDVEYVRIVYDLVKTHIEGRVKVTPNKQYIPDQDSEAVDEAA